MWLWRLSSYSRHVHTIGARLWDARPGPSITGRGKKACVDVHASWSVGVEPRVHASGPFVTCWPMILRIDVRYSFRTFFSRQHVTTLRKNLRAILSLVASSTSLTQRSEVTHRVGRLHGSSLQLKWATLPRLHSVLPFKPEYRLGHPENYLFLLSKNIFTGSKYPKKIIIKFWKKLRWLHWVQLIRIEERWPSSWRIASAVGD